VATDARQPGRNTPGTGEALAIPKVGLPARSSGDPQPSVSRLDLTALHRKAAATLTRELRVGEEPAVVVCGLGWSSIVVTDRRAFVFKTGARSGLPFAARLKEFEFESIMRVDLRASGDEHVVVIHAPLKISVCASYWADGRDDPWRARNAIPVEPTPAVEAAVAEVSKMLSEFQHRRIARRSVRAADRRASDAGTPDVLDRLANLEVGNPKAGPGPLPPGPVAADCPGCGTELDLRWEFCPRCGAPAREPDSTPSRGRLRLR
jgi:hypothetical protein